MGNGEALDATAVGTDRENVPSQTAHDDLEAQKSSKETTPPSLTKKEDPFLVSLIALAKSLVLPFQNDLRPAQVTWDGPEDTSNPKNWSHRKKWTATVVVSTYTLVSMISSAIPAPALENMGKELHVSDPLILSLWLSVFVLGYAFGPFLIGPLSEIFGRVAVLQLSNLFYLCFNTAAGFSETSAQMIAFRFLSGLGGSAPFTIGGGILADCWTADERGKSISIYTMAPLLGPVIGPIVGGFITQHSTWRWVFWSVSIADGFVQISGFFFLRETYPPAILGKKAQQLRKNTGGQNWHTKWEGSHRTPSKVFKAALIRPIILLATQPIIQVLALNMAFVYALTYLMLTTLPTLWTETYKERIDIAGLNFISLGFGYVIGTQSTARLNDVIYKYLKTRSGNDVGRPEFRLPLLIPGSFLVPMGLLWYGWSAEFHLHWIMPNIGVAILGIGMKIGTQCTQTYAVDAYTLFVASAGAAGTFLRSLAGFGFPLFASHIYARLGFGWGNSILALVALVVGVPAPLLLWEYGPYLRHLSPYAAGDGE